MADCDPLKPRNENAITVLENRYEATDYDTAPLNNKILDISTETSLLIYAIVVHIVNH